MSDNKDKPQAQTISVDGFKDCDTPIQHKKKQLPVRYHTSNTKNDGGPDLIWVEAYAMQYDIKVNNIRPVNEAKSIYETTNELIYERLSEGGYEVDNIELVNESDAKEYWIYQLRTNGYKAAVRNDCLPDESKDTLGENELDYFFCDGSLKEGDRVVVGSYRNPDENKYIEITSKCRHQSGRDRWNFRYLEESEIEADENKEGDS